ncbi:hypothetical protein EVAR_13379_1 [Eumeta japonica]|uniref:Uncharacterized protein n=1 Tax=Eumeta variegata TaxID=151549 RepID=A0A4C1TS09_EUMVA|nr:hypothetical protein EVAR_13379_1 [Eumeta japonica]
MQTRPRTTVVRRRVSEDRAAREACCGKAIKVLRVEQVSECWSNQGSKASSHRNKLFFKKASASRIISRRFGLLVLYAQGRLRFLRHGARVLRQTEPGHLDIQNFDLWVYKSSGHF